MTAGSCQTGDNGALYPRRHQHDPRGHEPARSPHAADVQEEWARRHATRL